MGADEKSDTQEEGTKLRSLPLAIRAQYLKDLSFENPHAPSSLMGHNKQPNLNIDVDVNVAPIDAAGDQAFQNTFEVSLSIRASAKTGEQIAFIAELTYAGVFGLGNMPDETKKAVLLIECPRILFPFARAIMAEATRDGGFPPLMINPIDFADLYNRKYGPMTERGEVAGHA